MSPGLFWFAAGAFVLVVVFLALGYRRMARAAELDAAERVLRESYEALECPPPASGVHHPAE